MGQLKLDKTGMLVAGDELEIPRSSFSRRYTSMTLLVETPPTGAALTVRLQDIPGATPNSFIEAAIAAGDYTGTVAVGSVSIPVGDVATLRIVSAPTGGDAPSFLQAFVEYDTRDSAGETFATVAELRREEGIQVATFDDDLLLILQSITRAMQNYMGRIILPQTYTDERHWISRSTRELYVEQGPILPNIPVVVTVDGADVADFTVDYEKGRLYRDESWWPSNGTTLVTYMGGYDPTPVDLVRACINQSRLEWKNHYRGGDRLGTESRATDGGGSSQYFTTPRTAQGSLTGFLPLVRDILNGYRRMI